MSALFPPEADAPDAEVPADFSLRPFMRSSQERALLADAAVLVDQWARSPWAYRLRLLAMAGDSSPYALQTEGLRLLEELEHWRMSTGHQRAGASSDPDFAGERQTSLASSAALYERTLRIVKQVDDLDYDARLETLREVLTGVPTDFGDTVVFCTRPRTADYLLDSLRFLSEGSAVRRLGRKEIQRGRLGPSGVLIVSDNQLKGLIAEDVNAGVNYDLAVSPRRMHLRWSRLVGPGATERRVRIETLVDTSPAGIGDQRALLRMPYLSGVRDV
jgi:hypothetical protein